MRWGHLGARTHSRNKLRTSGMPLQLFKTMCEVRELKREEALRGLEEPEGEIDGNKDKRVMDFGEYHHWAYERVLNEKPN